VKRLFICMAVIFPTALCWGQAPAPPADDPIAQTLFAPELVMKFRQEINLDDNQSRAIKGADKIPRSAMGHAGRTTEARPTAQGATYR
jgi:hypothetical protein